MSRLDVDLRSVDITLTEDAAFNLIDTPEGPEAVVHLAFSDLKASVTIPLALIHRISGQSFDAAMRFAMEVLRDAEPSKRRSVAAFEWEEGEEAGP